MMQQGCESKLILKSLFPLNQTRRKLSLLPGSPPEPNRPLLTMQMTSKTFIKENIKDPNYQLLNTISRSNFSENGYKGVL